MVGGGTYEYLGPVGNSANNLFGANYGNKNGIGIVIDPSKESWNPKMDAFISRNPDGTIEWCGPYASDQYAASGSGGCRKRPQSRRAPSKSTTTAVRRCAARPT